MITPLRAVLLAATAVSLTAASTTPADDGQEPVTPAELRQIACVTMRSIPPVRASIEAGNGPLLVVSGREAGVLRRPSPPCTGAEELPRGASEVRYIRPHTAPDLYGARARHGAILIDLPASAQG